MQPGRFTLSPYGKIMKEQRWTLEQMPRLEGKTAVVTGANSGLGFHTSRALARSGARVIMACRDLEKGQQARQMIMETGADAEPEVWHLDLASLDSVKGFALKYEGSGYPLDLLINNAGLMAIPLNRTEEGFEMQFGVNHLGHFALSARLWPRLAESGPSRLVQLSSLAHAMGHIRFEDIHWERKYRKWEAYGMSKLANLLFIHELARRLKAGGNRVLAVAAHPGYADTELQAKGSRMKGDRLGAAFYQLANKLVAQSGEKGALPTLYAATAEGVEQGAYFGPGGLLGLHGFPAPDSPRRKLVNDEVAARLWKVSESLTGVEFRP